MSLSNTIVLSGAALFLGFWPKIFKKNKSIKSTPVEISEEPKMDLQDRIDLAMEQEFNATKDPELGYVPRERLIAAYEQLAKLQPKNGHNKAAISGIEWKERGPRNIGGRTRVILFDANDSTHKTVFAGSVAGGLWKTTNIYADEVEWTSVNDFFGNMAISAIAQDPTNPNIMYFGTGEGYFNSDAVRGDGIWKSTDGGTNWTQLAATTGSNFDYITKLIVDGSGNLIVGSLGYYVNNGGVYRSTNGGVSFSEVLERYTATSGAEYDRCADVEMAADGKTFYASMGISSTDGIFKSTDSAKTWTRIYNADSANERRIDLVCAPSNSNYVYALVQGSGKTIKKIMKSTNGGSNWTTCTTITWYDKCGSTPSTDFTRDQAWYNLASAVAPNDEDVLVVGGINIFKTTNGGTSWTQLSSWVGCGGYSEVHSDHHVLMFHPGSSDTMLNGNDGGIYVSKNVQSSPPTWTQLNSGYNVTQFYAAALHPTALNNYFLAGAQDNGTQRFNTVGINNTNAVTGGDGGFCHIDQNNPDTQISAYTYNNIRISTNGFDSYISHNSIKGRFINSSDYDDVNNILYAGSQPNYIFRWADIGSTPPDSTDINITAMSGGMASAILVSTSTPTTVYAGTNNGLLLKITNANTASPSVTNITGSSFPSGATVSCIAEDNFDADHLLITFSNYGVTSVWETVDGGTNWTNVEGNLPDMPIRWALFSPWGGDSALLATELGVWSTTNLNGSSTNWAASNTGLANCRVDMLQFRTSDSLVLAATHGRGVYTTTFFSKRVLAQFGTNKTVAYVGETIQFYDDSYGATSLSWDFDDDGNSESTEQNPTFAYGEGGIYTVRLTINGTTSTTKTIQILPNMKVPYTTSDGGNMESNAWHFAGRIASGDKQLWERGAPTNYFGTSHYNGSYAWVTDLDGDMIDANISCELLTPNYNFSKSGTYTLSFVKSMEVQYCNGPFAAQVQYSTNKGKTWTRLGSDVSGGTNWYERGPNQGCQISTYIFSDEMGWSNYYTKSNTSHDVSFLAGNESVCFRLLFTVSSAFSSGYDRAGFLVDDFQISGPANEAITGGGIETTLTSATQNLGAYDSATYYSSNGKIMAKMWNQSSHNFGATSVEIDQVGTTAVDFDNNTANAEKIFSKTIKITPTTNNTNAQVKIALYYTDIETNGWQSVTGLSAEDIQLFKTTYAVASSTVADGVYPSSTVLDSNFDNGNLCVAGIFSNGFSGVGTGGGVGPSPGPLPITLLSFTAIKNDEEILLSWQTSSEINNSHFEIWRAVNNDKFEKIGIVNGHGNSSQTIAYNYADVTPEANSADAVCYYLKQVDFNGIYELSKTICLSADDMTIDFIIGPNPIQNILNIDVNPWVSEKYGVEIINLNGTVVLKQETLEQHNDLDISPFASGTYLVCIKLGNETVRTEKIIKQ
ncbi:MAG: T9SS type A sorting domain-containing protein [Flavobacteriales bacterium]|nr:T9SS type A sorting domain-containing protein [Flavobacteriales bacterium]